MLNSFIKLLSLCLLISITFSFPILQSQGQYRNQTGASEITFFGKEEAIWIEKRAVRLPVMMGQGIKEEPWGDSFDLREHSIGPMKKMSPSTPQPGCAYSSRVTSGMTQVLVGDKALYEKGMSYYIKEAYEDASTSFQKLIREYPESEWIASSYYWMGETRFHQGRDVEAFSHYYKVVEKYPKSEFYAYALYSCGWIRLRQGVYKEGNQFFHQVHEKTPTLPIAESSLFWSGYCLYHLGRYEEALQEVEALLQKYPKGKWRPEADYLIGVRTFRLKRFKEASDRFKVFWKRYPRSEERRV